MSGELQFYLIAVPAVIVLGLSKGGFTGLSSLAMPMLSRVTSPDQGRGDRPAGPDRAGLGERLGVPARLFAAEPHHPRPVVDDRHRSGLSARGAGQRGCGPAR